ncbi:MAG: 4Fe-4S binding protein [Candidatus Omnitrophota bacterium]
MKKSQFIMVWFLPLVVIGGFFYPALGYFVIGSMVFMLALSVSRPRHWCWNLCPRGAFLDLWLSRVSLKKPVPGIFARQWFRWVIFVLAAGFLISRLARTGWDAAAIGLAFVMMCLVSTIIAIILGIATKPRAWCVMCPMGLLQEKAGKIKKK